MLAVMTLGAGCWRAAPISAPRTFDSASAPFVVPGAIQRYDAPGAMPSRSAPNGAVSPARCCFVGQRRHHREVEPDLRERRVDPAHARRRRKRCRTRRRPRRGSAGATAGRDNAGRRSGASSRGRPKRTAWHGSFGFVASEASTTSPIPTLVTISPVPGSCPKRWPISSNAATASTPGAFSIACRLNDTAALRGTADGAVDRVARPNVRGARWYAAISRTASCGTGRRSGEHRGDREVRRGVRDRRVRAQRTNRVFDGRRAGVQHERVVECEQRAVQRALRRGRAARRASRGRGARRAGRLRSTPSCMSVSVRARVVRERVRRDVAPLGEDRAAQRDGGCRCELGVVLRDRHARFEDDDDAAGGIARGGCVEVDEDLRAHARRRPRRRASRSACRQPALHHRGSVRARGAQQRRAAIARAHRRRCRARRRDRRAAVRVHGDDAPVAQIAHERDAVRGRLRHDRGRTADGRASPAAAAEPNDSASAAANANADARRHSTLLAVG